MSAVIATPDAATAVEVGTTLTRIQLADGTDAFVDFIGFSRHGSVVYRVPSADGYGEFGQIPPTEIAAIWLD